MSDIRLPRTLSSSCGSGAFRSLCRDQAKYALAYVAAGTCVLRYENEAGKGDHRHLGAIKTAYGFTTPAKLLEDFWSDVDQWRPE